jgi:ubiquinone/menaquinone biosynthesis C-methylase UbiE
MFKDNRAYYDEFSDWYERERHDGYHAMLDDLEAGLLEPYLRGAHVLEVGCGTGLVIDRIRSRAERVVGVDISPGMLASARKRGFDVVCGDATRLPFADESFDLVYSYKVLAHVQDIERALREMSRVTRRGGHLVLEFYNPLSLRYLSKRLAGPGKISAATDEAAVYTRWDHAVDISRRLPEDVEVVDYSGVRVLTPAARAHRVPVLGSILRVAERAALHSPLRYFGGFLVVTARKS